ncbi:MAG TPA: ATP-binding protein [Gammaproteobacteria bacterium]
MQRTILVLILAIAALTLLVSFAWQSRSVPADVHVAQNTVATETARLGEEFGTLLATLESARQNSEKPGEAARALEVRLSTSPERLSLAVAKIPGNRSQRERIQNNFQGLTATVSQSSTLARDVIAEQNAFVDSLTYLRDAGPQIIQQMRNSGLERVAADTFQLVVGAVGFASPNTAVQEYELRRLLVTLGRDQRIDQNMPEDLSKLLSAATMVLNTKASIRSKLGQLVETPLAPTAASLAVAVDDVYRSSVAAVDRARLMLSIYAVVMLVAVGLIAYGLQSSYRVINRTNRELASLNASLEQRVTERTEELQGTLSDLKESQVQLVQAEKMSSLGQLVAGISHEINTPLLYLANNATLIQERIDLLQRFVQTCAQAFGLRAEDYPDRAAYQAKFVQSLRDLKIMMRDDELESNLQEAKDLAKDSIDGLADLTEIAQSLKDFSRLDRAPIGSFDVNAGLDRTLVIARNIVKHKAEIHKFYGEIPEIECAPSQINQVFLNLITNAAQAIETQGEIVITTKQRDARHVAIAISDTGCGIPEENLSKIRDPFFTTKEVGTGTGLGLSIVDEIIRGHGGELLVESKVGHGSTFTVMLPVKQRTQAPQAARADEGMGAAELDVPELAEAV